MKTPRCDQCHWYTHHASFAGVLGECHYNPPLPAPYSEGAPRMPHWPIVRVDDFCREWTVIEPEPSP